MVERDRSIQSTSATSHVVEDKKCHRVVAELSKFGVIVAGLQATHCFGADLYVVDGFTVLSSGRPVPEVGTSHARGEGVAIVLNDVATLAWKAGGNVWHC